MSDKILTLYWSSMTHSAHQRSAIEHIRLMLDGNRLKYKEINLCLPEFEKDKLKMYHISGTHELPQLHYQGKFIGCYDDMLYINEAEEWDKVFLSSYKSPVVHGAGHVLPSQLNAKSKISSSAATGATGRSGPRPSEVSKGSNNVSDLNSVAQSSTSSEKSVLKRYNPGGITPSAKTTSPNASTTPTSQRTNAGAPVLASQGVTPSFVMKKLNTQPSPQSQAKTTAHGIRASVAERANILSSTSTAKTKEKEKSTSTQSAPSANVETPTNLKPSQMKGTFTAYTGGQGGKPSDVAKTKSSTNRGTVEEVNTGVKPSEVFRSLR